MIDLNDNKHGTMGADPGSPHYNLHMRKQARHVSDNQTLKIEEVFTSSTRQSGNILLIIVFLY